MTKSFRPLFTLFLGILFFILTFTANSEATKKYNGVCLLSTISASLDVREWRIIPTNNNKACNYYFGTYFSKQSSEKEYDLLRLYYDNPKTLHSLTHLSPNPYRKLGRVDIKVIKIQELVNIMEGTEYGNLLVRTYKKKPSQTQEVAKKKKEKNINLVKLTSDEKEILKEKKKNVLIELSSEEKENLIEELKGLAKLYEEGVLTEEEFSQLKAKVLEQTKPTQRIKATNKKIFKIRFNKLATQSEEKCIPEKRKGFVKIDEKLKYFKKKYCISLKDIAKLGIYQEFNDYPEDMLKEFGKCKKFNCQSKMATQKMYMIFVKRGEQYHARHPEKMIQGMAWYEIMYLSKLKKTMPAIEKYIRYIKGNYNYDAKWKKTKDEEKIESLISMNKGRENMRVAMGLSLEDDLAYVLKSHWLLGELIGNNELKVKKVILNPEIKKRKNLLAKYQRTLRKYKAKLEEKKNTKSYN